MLIAFFEKEKRKWILKMVSQWKIIEIVLTNSQRNQKQGFSLVEKPCCFGSLFQSKMISSKVDSCIWKKMTRFCDEKFCLILF